MNNIHRGKSYIYHQNSIGTSAPIESSGGLHHAMSCKLNLFKLLKGAEFKVCGPYSGSLVYASDQMNLKLVGDHADAADVVSHLNRQRFALVVSVSISR